jgi:hypothetical protein
VEEILSRLKRLGDLVIHVEGVGGTSMLGIAIRPEEEGKIQLLTEALKPVLIQNLFVGQSSPLKIKLRRTDFMIMKCLLYDPRMKISEIAKRISMTSKTVSYRLTKMKENRIMMLMLLLIPLR